MSARQQLLAWGGLLGLLLLAVWLLSDVLLPFLVGMAFAYFLDPAVDRLERSGVRRGLATLLIMVLFFAALAFLFVLLVPVVQDQLLRLLSKLPEYAARIRENVMPLVRRLLDAVDAGGGGDLRDALGGSLEKGLALVGTVVGGVLTSGAAVFNILSLLVITPVVTFYLLRDWDKLVARLGDWLPRQHAETIRAQVGDIDHVLAGYARGQAMVCLALSVYYATALTLAGLDFGLVIGIVTGLTSFIPFVGAFIGGLLALAVAAVQFWPDALRIGIVLAIFVAGQTLEGYVLVPRLVGDRVGLHPVWVIFGLLAGGALFGFVGVLIALPVFAAIGVVARFAIKRYLESPLYHGADPPLPPPP